MRVVNCASQADRQAIALWVGQRIPFVGDQGFGNSTGLAILSSQNTMMAGVIFHDWQPEFKTLAFSIAADTPRWATRSIIKALFTYPFEHLGVEKLWTITPFPNERALRLVRHVGFVREAVLARHLGPHGHAVVSRMFREDYERLYGERHEQKARAAHAA